MFTVLSVSRVLLVLMLFVSVTTLLVCPQHAVADIINPKPKPDPRPPKPQPPLPKPPPPLEPDEEQTPVRNVMVGLFASFATCLLGLRFVRKNLQNRRGTLHEGKTTDWKAGAGAPHIRFGRGTGADRPSLPLSGT
jgi:hypothetical protein